MAAASCVPGAAAPGSYLGLGWKAKLCVEMQRVPMPLPPPPPDAILKMTSFPPPATLRPPLQLFFKAHDLRAASIDNTGAPVSGGQSLRYRAVWGQSASARLRRALAGSRWTQQLLLIPPVPRFSPLCSAPGVPRRDGGAVRAGGPAGGEADAALPRLQRLCGGHDLLCDRQERGACGLNRGSVASWAAAGRWRSSCMLDAVLLCLCFWWVGAKW